MSARVSVINAVRSAGEISRTEISAATGLTDATVSKEVRALLAEGVVTETGATQATGGRNRVLLRLDPSRHLAVGLHLHPQGVSMVALNLAGEVIARSQLLVTGERNPTADVTAVAGAITKMLSGLNTTPKGLLGIGMAAPGPLREGEGIAQLRPGMTNWLRYPIAQQLAAETGVPVVLDNDATASAVGELWTGGARGYATFGAIYLATGVGSGTILNSLPYRSATLNVGEIGHICADPNGPRCWCGNVGCVEAIAGVDAVVAQADAAGFAFQPDANTLGGFPLDPTPLGRFAQLAAAARTGDQTARAILSRSATYLGVATQALCLVMGLEMVTLTGPAFALAGEIYAPIIAEVVNRSALVADGGEIPVLVSAHAQQSAAVGAAALVLQDRLLAARRREEA